MLRPFSNLSSLGNANDVGDYVEQVGANESGIGWSGMEIYNG